MVAAKITFEIKGGGKGESKYDSRNDSYNVN